MHLKTSLNDVTNTMTPVTEREMPPDALDMVNQTTDAVNDLVVTLMAGTPKDIQATLLSALASNALSAMQQNFGMARTRAFLNETITWLEMHAASTAVRQ